MFASPNRTPFTTTNSSLNNSPLKLIHKSGAKKGSLISAAALAALNSKKKDRDDSMNYTNENKSPNKSRSLANTGGFGREIVNNDFEIRSEANRKSPTKKGKHVSPLALLIST